MVDKGSAQEAIGDVPSPAIVPVLPLAEMNFECWALYGDIVCGISRYGSREIRTFGVSGPRSVLR